MSSRALNILSRLDWPTLLTMVLLVVLGCLYVLFCMCVFPFVLLLITCFCPRVYVFVLVQE